MSPQPAGPAAPVLEARGLVKRFGGVTALGGVGFRLHAGEVHAICGENGAGKSTLLKLLAGVHPRGSYQGELLVDGRPVAFRSTRDAERAGIAIVHQELALFDDMSVAENLFLADLPRRRLGRIDWEAVLQRARALLADVGIALDPSARVGDLGVGQRQLVEIARALARSPRVLVLDEPTAALARHEVDALLGLVRRLRDAGVACAYVSHKLDEVFAIADRITVLRDGVAQGTEAAGATDASQVIARMVGRPIQELYRRRRAARGAVRLRVRGLTVARAPGLPPLLHDVDLEVAAGEVLGIGGLMGAGRSELLLHLAGHFGRRLAGEVELDGQRLPGGDARAAARAGLAWVTEDRKRLGLVPGQGVAFNLTLASLARLRRGPLVDEVAELEAARRIVESLRIKAASLGAQVGSLSGGNQQKVVLGKALLTAPRVLLLDEPTRGIDVGAKLEVYQLVDRLAGAGCAIVMVSSELPELLGMADRIVMLGAGRVGGTFDRAEATPERLLGAAMRHAGVAA
ncbi:MAG: sugar ABC transporter ATP-binding protein [Steroidobacteraceae bacterium]|jgi:D-xylose transport system ATP-binding protein|nr:sugar ABC transporter ATP-binding protein [Steroidobacteraceae bacterium]